MTLTKLWQPQHTTNHKNDTGVSFLSESSKSDLVATICELRKARNAN